MPVLYIVATPIGNLEDLSRRACRILAEADLILCEDTRQTVKLLNHLGISKKLISFHSHTGGGRLDRIEGLFEEHAVLAYASDAGTPGLSDPGSELVRLARSKGWEVIPVPGPSAFAALLSACPYPLGSVVFEGFLSPKPGRRRNALKALLADGRAFVLYESPYRILKLMADLAELEPECRVFLGREMTKMHEEYLEGRPDELTRSLTERNKALGEFSILVYPEKKR